MTPETPTFDFRPAKKQFSRIGWALLTFWLVTLAVQTAYVFLAEALPFLPHIVGYGKRTMLFSMLSMYGFGLPACLLVLRGTEKSAPVKSKISAGTWFGSFCVAITFLYIGSGFSDVVLSWFSTVADNLPTDVTGTILSSLPWYWNAFFSVLFAPLVEEFVFRKQLIDRTRMYGEKTAILFSALMFAFFHMSLYQFFYAFLIGLLLGYLYMRTGKLWVCMLLHGAVNLVGSVLPLALLRSVDLDELMDAYMAEDMEAVLQFAEANMGAMAGISLFGLLLIAANIAGIVYLLRSIRSLRFYPAERDLPRGEEAVVYTAIGVICYIAFTFLYPLLEMLFQNG